MAPAASKITNDAVKNAGETQPAIVNVLSGKDSRARLARHRSLNRRPDRPYPGKRGLRRSAPFAARKRSLDFRRLAWFPSSHIMRGVGEHAAVRVQVIRARSGHH